LIATTPKCTKGIAMVALAAANYVRAVRLANFEEILSRKLQCRFHGFASTTDEIDMIDSIGSLAHQHIGELFSRFGGKEASMRKSHGLQLLTCSVDDFFRSVTKTTHRGSSTGIEIAITFGIDEINSITCNSSGQVKLWRSAKN
jgi:hypothetical protein